MISYFKRVVPYTVSIAELKAKPEKTRLEFLKKRRHKDGQCIDLLFIENDIFDHDSILPSVGDKLFAYKGPMDMGPLDLKNENGEYIGRIPMENSIFPTILLESDISVWCFVEAVDASNTLPEIAVSLYCEEY